MKKVLLSLFSMVFLFTLTAYAYYLDVKRAEGIATASFEVPLITPEYENNGYRQNILKSNGYNIAEITVSFSPIMSRSPLPRIKGKKTKKEVDQIAWHIAGKSEREIDAVIETIKYLRSNIEYSINPDDSSKPLDVINSKKGNCLGIANAMCSILSRLGIESRIVYGMRFPANLNELELKGGAIHAWVEVHYPDVGWVFSDPRWGINGVSANYIVLSVGMPPSFDFLHYLKGKKIRLLKKSGGLLFDRIFDKDNDGIIFERPNIASGLDSTISGRVTAESGNEVSGEVSLSSKVKKITIPIKGDGFIFENLEAGEYVVCIKTKNSELKKNISISPFERINLSFEIK